MQEKRALRELIQSSLALLHGTGYFAWASARIVEQVAQRIQLTQAKHVALFAGREHEVDLRALVGMLPTVEFFFPRVCSKRQLAFHRVRDLVQDMEVSAIGIDEPSIHLPTCSPAQMDIIIVPGLAFSEHGDRLGYGGGYYDVVLAGLSPSTQTIGVAFQCQRGWDIPCEPHDQRVGVVVCV